MAHKPPTKLVHRWEAEYMQDRISASNITRWRTDSPPHNTVCEVWYINSCILATFDGHMWHTTEGADLPGVSHWRELHP